MHLIVKKYTVCYLSPSVFNHLSSNSRGGCLWVLGLWLYTPISLNFKKGRFWFYWLFVTLTLMHAHSSSLSSNRWKLKEMRIKTSGSLTSECVGQQKNVRNAIFDGILAPLTVCLSCYLKERECLGAKELGAKSGVIAQLRASSHKYWVRLSP